MSAEPSTEAPARPGGFNINPQGAVAKKLHELGMNQTDFADTLELVDKNGSYHPRFETYYKHLCESGDLPEDDVDDFFLRTFGTIYLYDKVKLAKFPRFWAQRQCKMNNGFQDKLDMTSFDDRDHYDRLETAIREWCVKHPAPRTKQDLIKYLESLFKDSESGFDELELEDLEFLGQVDYVVQQGPQSALLAHMHELTFYNNEWLPLNPPTDFPDPKTGQEVAKCFWGPVRKYKQNGKWIVSKCINLTKLQRNSQSQQRFNDYPPNEIATHRYMQHYFNLNNCGISESCPYICELLGVTEDSHSRNIYYWMEYGDDYFSKIANGYSEYLKKWKRYLKSHNLGRQHIRTTKSPWEEERCLDFIKLAKGMYFMHRLGIAHRDFKLENTILGLDGNVKLIDFGVGHRFGFWEQSSFRCVDRVGTATYMSPECSSVKRSSRRRVDIKLEQYDHWDARANDIWTLGIALFMMLFACPPYDTCNNADTRFVYLTAGRFLPTKQKKPPNASLRSLLKCYSRLAMVTDKCMDFLMRFFLPEQERITWEEIWKHPWLLDCLDKVP